MPKPTRPIGYSTRGKTARNRLRRVDIFLIRYASNLLKRQDGDFKSAFYVDLGFGQEPFTTLESADQFRKLNPNLKVLGVEIDAQRVTAASPFEKEYISFRLGGFNIPLTVNEHTRLIRAFNVLRQYKEDQVTQAYQSMLSSLLPDGLLIEGTADPFGRIWCANLVRKSADGTASYEGLTFSTNFRWGFDPGIFQTVLPKNLIHHVTPGENIYSFFQAWKEAANESIGFKQYGLRQWFHEAGTLLAEKGYQIDLRKKFLRAGFLIWKYPDVNIDW